MQPVKVWTHGDVGNASVVDTREESQSKDGAVQDLIGGFTPDVRCHRVADMLGNADPAAEGLGRVRQKQRIMDFVTNRFQPRELKERTDVSNSSRGQEDGLAVVE